MSDKQETLADIIAEKRREADYIEESARGHAKAGETMSGTPFTEEDLEFAIDDANKIRKEADRLEAARKRDAERDRQMRVLGLKVIRVNDGEVRENPERIAALLLSSSSALFLSPKNP